jgi:hypothetical protein
MIFRDILDFYTQHGTRIQVSFFSFTPRSLIMDQSDPRLACIFVDVENITDVYRLHAGHACLKLVRYMLQETDTYLEKYGFIAPVGCRKVFLARSPPECLREVLQEFNCEVVVSTYTGKDAADTELLDHFRAMRRIADSQYVAAFVVIANDKIFKAISTELGPSPFASVCIGLNRPTRWLSEFFDEVLWLWWDRYGVRLVRRSAKSLGCMPQETVLASA